MNARSLQDDLLSIPGVEGAEVEGSDDKPAGLRIRIAEGADQRAVGGAIRRVLTSHGLGTDTRLPGEVDAVEGGAEVAAVPDLSDEATDTATATDTTDEARAVVVAEADEVIDLTEPVQEMSMADAAASMDATEEAAEPDEAPSPSVAPVPAAVAQIVADERDGGAVSSSAVPRLTSVSVEEGRGGIVVVVTAGDGTSVRQAAASSEGGVESAVVRATATLAQPHAPEATVVEIDDRRVEGVDIVMIVLEVDGRLVAGSAVVGAGRAFALARATWSALTM